MPIVKEDRDRKTFFMLLGESIEKYNASLYAYCLMENHFHLFLQTALPNLKEVMWYLQSHYARYFNERYERVGPLFQGRYRSKIVDADSYSLAVIRYIHQNPLKAGIIKELKTYPWSSYPCYLGLLPHWPWLNTEWALNQFGEDQREALLAFEQFHQEKEESLMVPGTIKI